MLLGLEAFFLRWWWGALSGEGGVVAVVGGGWLPAGVGPGKFCCCHRRSLGGSFLACWKRWLNVNVTFLPSSQLSFLVTYNNDPLLPTQPAQLLDPVGTYCMSALVICHCYIIH